MAWVILLVAAGFEVVWAVGLKYTEGFTRIGPTVLTIVCNIIGMWLLALAMRTIPIGTAYAMWTGIGVMATVTGGIVLFGEVATPARLACVGLILAGIIGLHVIGSG